MYQNKFLIFQQLDWLSLTFLPHLPRGYCRWRKTFPLSNSGFSKFSSKLLYWACKKWIEIEYKRGEIQLNPLCNSHLCFFFIFYFLNQNISSQLLFFLRIPFPTEDIDDLSEKYLFLTMLNSVCLSNRPKREVSSVSFLHGKSSLYDI